MVKIVNNESYCRLLETGWSCQNIVNPHKFKVYQKSNNQILLEIDKITFIKVCGNNQFPFYFLCEVFK